DSLRADHRPDRLLHEIQEEGVERVLLRHRDGRDGRRRGDASVRRLDPRPEGHDRVASSHHFRYFVNQATIATVGRIRLGVLRKPGPSSGKRTYSTGTFRFFKLSTTCSASTTGTLVSLAPWSTIVGAVTRSTLWIGESS